MKKLKTIFIISLIILSFVTISVIANTPENNIVNSEEDDCADCNPAPSQGTPEYDDCMERKCLPCLAE